MPSNRSGENFIEFALTIILLAIVMLSIPLIVGDSIRVFLNEYRHPLVFVQQSAVAAAGAPRLAHIGTSNQVRPLYVSPCPAASPSYSAALGRQLP